jgi:hypothetical protein
LAEGGMRIKMNAGKRATIVKGEASNRIDRVRKKNGFELRFAKSRKRDVFQFTPELKNE